MIYQADIEWDANYDVVVLGFGGAGATAARFAADQDGAGFVGRCCSRRP